MIQNVYLMYRGINKKYEINAAILLTSISENIQSNKGNDKL